MTKIVFREFDLVSVGIKLDLHHTGRLVDFQIVSATSTASPNYDPYSDDPPHLVYNLTDIDGKPVKDINKALMYAWGHVHFSTVAEDLIKHNGKSFNVYFNPEIGFDPKLLDVIYWNITREALSLGTTLLDGEEIEEFEYHG